MSTYRTNHVHKLDVVLMKCVWLSYSFPSFIYISILPFLWHYTEASQPMKEIIYWVDMVLMV